MHSSSFLEMHNSYQMHFRFLSPSRATEVIATAPAFQFGHSWKQECNNVVARKWTRPINLSRPNSITSSCVNSLPTTIRVTNSVRGQFYSSLLFALRQRGEGIIGSFLSSFLIYIACSNALFMRQSAQFFIAGSQTVSVRPIMASDYKHFTRWIKNRKMASSEQLKGR